MIATTIFSSIIETLPRLNTGALLRQLVQLLLKIYSSGGKIITLYEYIGGILKCKY